MEKEKLKKLSEEAVEIIKDIIINNELVNGDLISYVGRNEKGDTVILRDLLNQEFQYSLSEISYVFMDNIVPMGHENKSPYETVLDFNGCEDYDYYKDKFMQSLSRLKEIEKSL